MDILPVQGSAVPCEQVFSSSKETITMCQNRSSPELMEALQILKFSIQHGCRLNFSEGTDHATVLQEMEMMTSDATSIPEDITAFIDSLVVNENLYNND